MLKNRDRIPGLTQDQIKSGLCYINTNKSGLVRKVLNVEFGFVYYKPLNGGLFKRSNKNITFYRCMLKHFAKWATAVVEEKDRFPDPDLAVFTPPNFFTVLNTKGDEFLKCKIKKLNRYFRRGFIEWVDRESGVAQFKTDHIETRILEIYNGKLPYGLLDAKYQHCVVCGTEENLTRHHVVPKPDLKCYPVEIKSCMQNFLTVCHDCHMKYENKKRQISITGYTVESAIAWMNHFIETMKPKFLSEKWHILTDYYLKHGT